MKKLLIILILGFVVLLCGCTKEQKSSLDEIKERGYLIVGVKYDAKPFGFVENGEIKGYDIDIAKNIAKNIFDDENKIEFIEVNSENRISKLMNGEIDMIIATMTDTQDRRVIVDFSESYYVSGQAVLCKKPSDVSSVADLKNHNVVVVIGTTAEKTLRKFYTKSNVIRALDYKEAFDTIDENTCLISDDVLLKGFMINNKDYQMFSKKLSEEPYAVALRKDEEELKQIVNNSIKSLKQSGEIDKIKNKWMN